MSPRWDCYQRALQKTTTPTKSQSISKASSNCSSGSSSTLTIRNTISTVSYVRNTSGSDANFVLPKSTVRDSMIDIFLQQGCSVAPFPPQTPANESPVAFSRTTRLSPTTNDSEPGRTLSRSTFSTAVSTTETSIRKERTLSRQINNSYLNQSEHDRVDEREGRPTSSDGKQRPETSDVVARRMICAALGVKILRKGDTRGAHSSRTLESR